MSAEPPHSRPSLPWLPTEGPTSGGKLPLHAHGEEGIATARTTRTGEPTLELSSNARTVLERRYLARDDQGNVVETPEELFRRVAHTIAQAERAYGATRAQVASVEQRFLALLTSLCFLPNSPTLGNAGRPLQQLSACFVLPVEDSMDGIFETVKDMALIHKSGGGTGFAFSRLRPAGDHVGTTGGIASGPVSFMRVFDSATEAIKQGGARRGANMAILAVDHPDIEEFIALKSDMVSLQNFNISVAVGEPFMEAVERDGEYDLISPRTGEVTGRRSARRIFHLVAENAWRNGDPGLVFLDRINRDNPTPGLGRIEATNPCGEQPLLPYESCNLGSIDLARFARDGDLDWDALAAIIPDCVRFLDDVIDANVYPMPQIDAMTRKTRKIGLGVMGWADLLLQLRLPYDSEEAIALGERVMSFIQEHADRASEALGRDRRAFPAWEGSVYDPRSGDPRAGPRFRNATRTTVAPTGTLSIIADTSGGIEPVFSLAFMRRHHLDPEQPERVVELPEVNKHFLRVATEEGFHSQDLIEELARGGTIRGRADVPEWVQRVFVTSHDVSPEWHVRMQAAFQRHTDNAVSKTINFPHDATVGDVERAYLLAYREGCKGITIYRDLSRPLQVLSHAILRGPEQAEAIEAEAILGTAAPAREAEPPSAAPEGTVGPYRRRLPDERQSITHKFRVGEQEGYITVGLFEDGAPGEVFITISKEGSTIRGLMDSVAVLTSLALQYGVPVQDLARKFRNVRFEPHGFTDNPELPQASSLVDYIFRWLEDKFSPEARATRGRRGSRGKGRSRTRRKPPADTSGDISTGLACPECGSVLVYAEGCLICRSCGYTKCG